MHNGMILGDLESERKPTCLAQTLSPVKVHVSSKFYIQESKNSIARSTWIYGRENRGPDSEIEGNEYQ